MSRKKMTTIALFIGAAIVLAGGAFALLSDHMKSGIGLFVVGGILIVAGLVTLFFFRSSTEEVELNREWM